MRTSLTPHQMTTACAALLMVWATAFPLGVQADHQTANTREPDSYEFKVLLSNEAFVDRNTAIEAFLLRFDANAKRHRSRTKWKDAADRKVKQREVCFLDTRNKLMRGHGLIFRTRIQMEVGCDAKKLDSCAPAETKVTLKQRAGVGTDPVLFHVKPDLEKAASFDGQKMLAAEKFEADWGWKKNDSGGKDLVITRSLSSDVETKDINGRGQTRHYATLGKVMAVYPEVAWGDLKGHGSEALSSTCQIASTVVKVGKLKLGDKVNCKASFAFWFEQTDGTPLATEFSYTCDNNRFTNDKRGIAVAVFEELLLDTFIKPEPDSKTAIARRCSTDLTLNERR